MSHKANPALIGAFVLTAVLIAICGMLILGSGKFFQESNTFVLHFEGSLAGLDVGAPVEYGGVRIGTVTDIRLIYNTDDGNISIPVYIEILRDQFTFSGTHNQAKGMQYHIEKGLRAQLQSQSFVTGKLKVMLLMDPKSEAHFKNTDPSMTEIPTVRSMMEDIEKSMDELPLQEIVMNISRAVEDIAKMTQSGDLQATLSELRNISVGIAAIMSSGDIQAVVKELRETAENVAELTRSIEIAEATQAFTDTMTESKQLIQTLNQSIGPVQQDLSETLEEFEAATKSLRYLTEYLERHPEALIRGKGKE